MNIPERMRDVLGSAYSARVLRGDGDPLLQFEQHLQEDPAFLAHVRAEYDRLAEEERKLGCPWSRRCFVTGQHFAFLREALAAHDKGPA